MNSREYRKLQEAYFGVYDEHDEAREVDLYDVILSYLLDEGFADTLEAAEGIMASMSEGWVEQILDESIGSSIAKIFPVRKSKPKKTISIDREKLERDRAAMKAFVKK